MGKRGPTPAPADGLYGFAHQFYWDFRRIAEGTVRQRPGKKEYEEALETLRERHLSTATEANVSVIEDWINFEAAQASMKQLKVAGEPDVVRALMRAKSADRVRRICRDSANWPIPLGSALPHYLSEYAEEFVAAANDSRFPRSNRPSNQLKQFWFLARALAGAVYGVSARTAINLVGSMRPEEAFAELRDAKPRRRKVAKNK